jgi:hypothetical protein
MKETMAPARVLPEMLEPFPKGDILPTTTAIAINARL